MTAAALTSSPTLRFANGDTLPAFGLGTWKSEPGEVAAAIKAALELGYRHIDCAAIYGNEKEIGEAFSEVFAEGKIRREEVWITSKLWNDAHAKDDVHPALEKTLADLQLDYLDLYLMHWPVASEQGGALLSLEECPILTTWTAMEALVTKGLCKHIGVSNFSVQKLQALVENATHKPEMNQIELHPFLQQPEMLSFCESQGIHLTAYSPLGSPGRPAGLIAAEDPVLLEEPVLQEIAAKKNISAAQVLLRWALQRGTAVIPKSVRPKRIAENFAALDGVLSQSEVDQLTTLDRHRRYVDGSFWVQNGGPYTLANLWDES